jgi:hypothetical protein
VEHGDTDPSIDDDVEPSNGSVDIGEGDGGTHDAQETTGPADVQDRSNEIEEGHVPFPRGDSEGPGEHKPFLSHCSS